AVGNGIHEYNVPLASGAFRNAALTADNLACKADDNAEPALHLKDDAQPGVLIVRMPSSYVYLTGEASFDAVVGAGGKITASLSVNNGLAWKELKTVDASGRQKLD